jgi:hypothetical protein
VNPSLAGLGQFFIVFGTSEQVIVIAAKAEIPEGSLTASAMK